VAECGEERDGFVFVSVMLAGILALGAEADLVEPGGPATRVSVERIGRAVRTRDSWDKRLANISIEIIGTIRKS
jgi:hypothetical protein